jgi:GntR family transcriptional regulator
MKLFQLNKNIPIPLYYQLKQYLIQEIKSGRLKPGDMVPSEREMSELYGISRMTVRQALQELVNEGILVREKGKGSFVAEPKISQGLLKLTSFSEDMRNRGMEPGALVLSQQVVSADEKIAELLRIDENDQILELRRVRYADDRPMAIEQTHLSITRFPGIEEQNFSQISLYQWLEEKYGINISHARQTIEVALPNRDEAEILGIPKTVPVILTERTTFDESGIPIEHAISIYRGDRYKLYVDLKR